MTPSSPARKWTRDDTLYLAVLTDHTNVGDHTHSRYKKTPRVYLFVFADAERILQAFTTEKELP